MPKIKFIDIPRGEKKNIFQQVSANTGIPAFAVEKDWWVVQTLAIIFEMDVAKHMVFKGGTSLSKAWKLINRFSEDIDLSINRDFFGFSGELSKSKRTKLRKTASEYTSGSFFNELQYRFTQKGFKDIRFNLVEITNSDQDPRIIELYYPNVIPPPGYLEPKVQIEVGSRSLREPFSIQTFGSLIDEYYPEMDFAQASIKVPTVNPERTFLEKIFLLHEEFQRPAEKMRVNRLSRHLYDIYHLSKTSFAEKALKDKELYSTIVDHRYKFTRVGGVNYNLHQPQTINPIPILGVIDAWKKDYNTMLEEMIYEIDPPTFEDIIIALTALKEEINALPWTFDLEFPTPISK